jgi:DNA-directed RNA polymerase specialized sigma24 family protein
LDLIRAVRRPNFDPIKPMRLVNKVLKAKVVDFLRRKRIRCCQNLDDIVELVAEDLRNSNTSYQWNLMLADDKAVFRRALDQAIDTLPPKQKSAAIAFVEVYDLIREQGSYKPLADRIKQMTGESVTAMQAKSNWHDARSKLEEKLARAGFRSLVEG